MDVVLHGECLNVCLLGDMVFLGPTGKGKDDVRVIW